MWVIVSVVTAAIFGGKPHEFSSVHKFPTEEACKAAMPDDARELLQELGEVMGVRGEVHLESHCEIDGEPI